jgi:hypothetical protein
MYSLFAITRDILKESQPSRQVGREPTVEHLAIAMLNVELRPFLSHWHPTLLAWERAHPGEPESAWPQDEQCRAELHALQGRLLEYVLGYGRLAGVANADAIVAGTLGPQFGRRPPVQPKAGSAS